MEILAHCLTKTPEIIQAGRLCNSGKNRFQVCLTWSIIPFSKRLITMVSKSPKDRVVGPLPNGRVLHGL